MKLHARIHLVGSGEAGLSDAWDCHVYALDCGSEIVLIDAGGGRTAGIERIEANLREDGLDPARIHNVLLTHWHKDHAGGAHVWRERLGARVHLNAIERAQLEAGDGGVPACAVDHVLAHGDVLALGDLSLQVIQVPSHSAGICAFSASIDGYRALFCADILFANGLIGLINYAGSDMAAYRQYLPRLANLGVDGLFPGHLMFVARGGQRHIDLALERVRGPFVPPSIGQSGITLVPPDDY